MKRIELLKSDGYWNEAIEIMLHKSDNGTLIADILLMKNELIKLTEEQANEPKEEKATALLAVVSNNEVRGSSCNCRKRNETRPPTRYIDCPKCRNGI